MADFQQDDAQNRVTQRQQRIDLHRGVARSPVAITTEYERLELEDYGVDIMVPRLFLRMLRRTGEQLHICLGGDDPDPTILTDDQQAVLECLRANGTMTVATLAARMGYSERHIKRWLGPDGPLRNQVVATAQGYQLRNKTT